MKIIAATLLVTTLCLNTKAQGEIQFNNTAATATKISTNSVPNGPPTGLTGTSFGSYNYALFYSKISPSVHGSTAAKFGTVSGLVLDDLNWSFATYGTNTALAGRLFSTTPNLDGSTTVNGVAGGAAAYFVVLGWSSSAGTTLNDLKNTINTTDGFWLGESAVSGLLTLGDGGPIPPSSLFGAATPFIPGFTLGVVVPEPSSVVMLSMGFSGLWLLKRRK